jgi:His/Glu/Gln/Arg/opine family amino acid ABC transporter permease subunit
MALTAMLAQYWPALLGGFWTTIVLSVTTIALSTPLALGIALARELRNPWLAWPSALYVNIFRMLPALLVLFFSFYAVPQLGLRLTPLAAATLGLTLMGVAYMSEDIRAGLSAVDPGQYRAARALGFTTAHTLRRIIIPQALPLIIPPYITRCIIMVKATSIASFVAVGDLTGEAVRATSITYQPFLFIVMAGVLYLVLSGSLALLQVWLEARFRIGRRAAGAAAATAEPRVVIGAAS